MKRTVGALMVLGGWIIVPSVVIWLLGGPLWAWVAIVGGLGVALLVLFCAVILFEFVAEKWGGDFAILCIFLLLWLIALTQALGFPWWAVLAGVGVVVAILVGILGFKWLVDE